MQYKTITLELIQENLPLYERLRNGKMLLTAMEAYAIDLKTSHDRWKAELAWSMPDAHSSQIAGAALELAVQELQTRLSCESPEHAAEPLTLDAAMNYVRGHSPPA
jgi:hypothetical protein